ncbi:MAG: YfhO family protein, partial [Thermoanaerobaculia bacterium]|nr:YfhO family protein [Thermoanaerobaculia bacterium]
VRPLPPEIRHDLDWALSPEIIREHGQSATVGDEYVPRTAEISRWQEEGTPRARAISTSGRVEIEVDQGTHMELVAKTPLPTLIEFARWDFPGWRATVDGRRVATHRGKGGSLTVRVSSGVHRVTLEYHGPQERRHGIAIGAFAILAGLLLGARSLGRGDPSPDAIVSDEEDRDGGR